MADRWVWIGREIHRWILAPFEPFYREDGTKQTYPGGSTVSRFPASCMESSLALRGGRMCLGFWHRLMWRVSLLILCGAPLAHSQQPTDCKRECERDYWNGVSECHRSHTLYNEIRRCQDAEEVDKRKCTDRCSEPAGREPGGCAKRCDRNYWDNVSTCYRSSYRYNDIQKCERSARETKDNCGRYCARRAKEVRP